MSDTMMRLTGIHLDSPLKFNRSEDYRSVYDTVDGEEVYLQHGTGKVFEPCDLTDLDLPAMWQRYTQEVRIRGQYHYDREEFLDTLRAQVYDSDDVDDLVKFCTSCGEAWHEDDTTGVRGGGVVCEDCQQSYFWCEDCEDLCPDDECNSTLAETAVCDRCLSRNWTYCEYCEGYRRDSDWNHDHDDDDDDDDEDQNCHRITCESPARSFTIRNDGEEPLANDTRITISLPAGVISAEGIGEIATYLRSHSYTLDEPDGHHMRMLSYRLEELDAKWQTREGNFTKRLSRFAYKEYGLKVAPEVISQVGCIARDQSTAVDHEIEITRNLNLPREAFAHSDSCWWTSYSESRCALKTNGGFGMRTFGDNDYGYIYGDVKGRAWVLPLREETTTWGERRLTPTFETQDPDAYVVFNGYGNLQGYAPARILSHMVGMTYRKIEFTCSPMYVNGSSGYLVAPEEIASKYTDGSLNLTVDQHSNLFESEKVLTHV